MTMDKYGVEDRKELMLKELEEVQAQIMSKMASPDEHQRLINREREILEALGRMSSPSSLA